MVALFCPQTKAYRQSERQVDSEAHLQDKSWNLCIDNERYQLQSNEANDIHLSSWMRYNSLRFAPVNTVPHSGRIESLWDCNYWGQGLDLSMKPSLCSKIYWTKSPPLLSKPWTARIVGAPQMTSQLVCSIFPCSLLPSWTWQTPVLSISWSCLPTFSSVCLVFFLLSLCIARWF